MPGLEPIPVPEPASRLQDIRLVLFTAIIYFATGSVDFGKH